MLLPLLLMCECWVLVFNAHMGIGVVHNACVCVCDLGALRVHVYKINVNFHRASSGKCEKQSHTVWIWRRQKTVWQVCVSGTDGFC